MISRNISVVEVTDVINSGEIISNYESDKPYPSKLLLKLVNGRPVHVVVAQNVETLTCILVTCYMPDPNLWDVEFKRKLT